MPHPSVSKEVCGSTLESGQARWIPLFTGSMVRNILLSTGSRESSAKLCVTLQQFLTELQSHGHHGGMAELLWTAVPGCTGAGTAGAGAQRGSGHGAAPGAAEPRQETLLLCSALQEEEVSGLWDGFWCVGALLSSKAELPTRCL